MPTNQYSLIPKPTTEKAIRARFPWIGSRPLMLPSGWMGLVHNTCLEIEAALAPSAAKETVEYFYGAVRESRMRIFLQLSDTAEREAHAVIRSLLNEMQSNSAIVCHICGNEILDQNHFNTRNAMPECGGHTHDDDHRDCEDDQSAVKATIKGKTNKKNAKTKEIAK